MLTYHIQYLFPILHGPDEKNSVTNREAISNRNTNMHGRQEIVIVDEHFFLDYPHTMYRLCDIQQPSHIEKSSSHLIN